MSYGSDSSLGVESEDDKEGHLSPGKHSSSIRRDRREQNNKSNWEKGLKVGGGRKYARHTPPEKVPISETSILLKWPGLTQVAIFPSPGNKTSGMARHEEGKFNAESTLYPWPIIPASRTGHTPTEGFQCQEGCTILGKSSKSQTLSPRLEHFGHPSLGSCTHKYRGGGGSGVREEIGE